MLENLPNIQPVRIYFFQSEKKENCYQKYSSNIFHNIVLIQQWICFQIKLMRDKIKGISCDLI